MAFLTFSVGSTAAYIVGLFVAGYAGAILRQLWYSQYLLIYKSWCRRACSQAAVVGFLPTVVLMLTYPFLVGKALLTGLSFILAIAMSLVSS